MIVRAMIVRAAILHAGRVYSLDRPGRHSDIIRMMARAGLDAAAMHDQGFLTDTGRFVDRIQARQIAERAGQLLPRCKDGYTGPELFSEDLW